VDPAAVDAERARVKRADEGEELSVTVSAGMEPAITTDQLDPERGQADPLAGARSHNLLDSASQLIDQASPHLRECTGKNNKSG